MTLKRTRKILAVVFFTLITLLFLDFTGVLHHYLGWTAKVQFLPAVLALNAVVIIGLCVITLIFGRIYCSVICPLGIYQDIVAWLGKKRKKNRYTYSKAISWLRYLMLAVMVVAVIMGIGSLVALLDPYGAFGRMATHLLQPVWHGANNVLASISEHFDSYMFYGVDVWVKSLSTIAIAAATAIIIGILAWKNGRTYCNTICPVGTLLGLLSRFSWMKVRFNAEKCRSCSLCSKNCKASCIDFKNHLVDYSRCVVCGDCIEKCKFDALHYAPYSRGQKLQAAPVESEEKTSAEESVDQGKRAFLLATAIATTAAMAQEKKKVDGGLATIAEKVAPTRQTPLTPPGSLSASNMQKRCTGCSLCVSECPNGVLRPSSDLLKLMQPTMSYERGYCRPECTRCSDVCPTGAIKPIGRDLKSSIQIGHAVWIKKNCIPLRDGVSCDNCESHCPTGAIELIPSDPADENSPHIPSVNESKCIGCGACENLCPARPFPAIYVEGHEVHKEI